MMRISRLILLGLLVAAVPRLEAGEAAPSLRDEAIRALKRAVTYYSGTVASRGGYLYYYSPDLKDRWGEGKFTADTIFVQPPGTPTVGMAYLKAYEATKNRAYLDAATQAAEALVYGQLESGGWTQAIHFGPAKRVGKYRNGKGGSWNHSSLDDGQSQAALNMLILADEAHGFKHAKIHEAAEYGLNALLGAQFPNGAFPQGWRGPVARHPVFKAKYPEYDWKTEGRIKNYWDYYTLNDDLAGTVSETLVEAIRVYKKPRYRAALEKLGDFLILAQMPDPQPGWCQQYNYEMIPIWARKFEPPAVTGGEAQDVMETLLRIHAVTENKKYLEPIPKALAYYKKLVGSDGRIPRYFELKTNKPLYMDRRYRLTYDESAVPSHYGWKQPARFDEIEAAYRSAKAGRAPAPAPKASILEAEVRRILKELDDQGRWITVHDGERLVGQPKFRPGFRYLSSGVFSRNVETLSAYIAATK